MLTCLCLIGDGNGLGVDLSDLTVVGLSWGALKSGSQSVLRDVEVADEGMNIPVTWNKNNVDVYRSSRAWSTGSWQ